MILDSVFEAILAILAMGAFSLTVLAIFTASILRLLARQRALEFRMAERIALVRRGLHPHTFQPLPASGPFESAERAAVPQS
jgi:hypothetical protein